VRGSHHTPEPRNRRWGHAMVRRCLAAVHHGDRSSPPAFRLTSGLVACRKRCLLDERHMRSTHARRYLARYERHRRHPRTGNLPGLRGVLVALVAVDGVTIGYVKGPPERGRHRHR
jgi:hypothetical protein